MPEENLQHGEPLESLSAEDLLQKAKSLVDELESNGYPGLSLGFLVTGSRYRLDSLFYNAKRQKEDEHLRQLSEAESDELWQSTVQSYDGMSAENLTETFRYQYDREQREKKLNGPKFPEAGSTEYFAMLNFFVRVSALLKEYKRRFPDKSPHDYLPSKIRGQWID